MTAARIGSVLRACRWFPGDAALADVYLLRVHGEEEHDGEACQQAGVLDGEGDEEAAAARLLLLPAHLVHLWELGETRERFILVLSRF